MKSLNTFCKELEADIIKAYEESPTLEESEKLAAKFLAAQMQLTDALRTADLDARMRKAGLKALKAGVYTEACTGVEKKPTENALAAIVDSSATVLAAQEGLDISEVDRDVLNNYFTIFREAHIYFRGISKGRFD